jgi:hypothetical protein
MRIAHPTFVRRVLALAFVAASGLVMITCGSDNGGSKCDICFSDIDCNQGKGYVCELYRDGISRCGDPRKPEDTCQQ